MTINCNRCVQEGISTVSMVVCDPCRNDNQTWSFKEAFDQDEKSPLTDSELDAILSPEEEEV